MLRAAMTSIRVMVLLDFTLPFHLLTDVSKVGAEAILAQYDKEGRMKPIAYGSWLFDSAQRNYTATERELLVIVMATRRWKPYFYGKKFNISTDYQLLMGFWNISDIHRKLVRWTAKLSQFDYSIAYLPGKMNTHINTPSRIHENTE